MEQAFSFAELSPLMPEIFLCASAFIVLLLGLSARPRVTPYMLWLTFTVLVLGLFLVGVSAAQPIVTLSDMFVADTFTQFSKFLMLIGAACVLLISGNWLTEGEGQPFEYLVLLLFSTLGLMLLISAQDLLAVYMALELSSLALYVLASFSRDHAKSSEAGLKYFVLGALGSGMMLFGISLIYGFTGTTNFEGLLEHFAGMGDEASRVVSKAVIVGLIMVMIAFCFKLSAVPFHMWTPDVYEGAPTPVTAFFAVAPKIAVMMLFTRFLLVPFGDLIDQWRQVIILISVASMMIGAFAALVQTNIKRLLAYSSIGHVGFMLMGLAAGSSAGVQGILVYLAVYLFMSAGAFGCVLLLKRDGVYLENLNDLSGLSRGHPIVAVMLAIFMFSMAGVPPLAGFFGKMYVVLAVVSSELTWLAVIGLLTSVVSCFYYLRVVKLMYFDEPVGAIDRAQGTAMRFGLGVSVTATVFYVFIPGPLIHYAQAAAAALLP